MSSYLTIEKRKEAFGKLGQYLTSQDEALVRVINSSHFSNAWFSPEQTKKAVERIGGMLNRNDLDQWLEQTTMPAQPKKIGLVLAGNIPMVGFHDILCVLAAGHIALVKLSSQDQKLLPLVLNKLIEFEPAFADQIQFTERLENFDAVIATGSGNTSRYFEHYFAKVPHIIRKNRNSIAVLTGNESPEDLSVLGEDIFDYFGLGCRNVSKVLVPSGYDFRTFFEAIEPYHKVLDHHKYSNNYDYNKSIYLVNGDDHLDNGFLLLKKDQRIASPLAVLYYEEYTDLTQLSADLSQAAEQIQCLVSSADLKTDIQQVSFGESQKPRLWDYADGIDTLNFLSNL